MQLSSVCDSNDVCKRNILKDEFLLIVNDWLGFSVVVDVHFLLSWPFAWKVFVATSISCIPLFILKYLRWRFAPPTYSKLTWDDRHIYTFIVETWWPVGCHRRAFLWYSMRLICIYLHYSRIILFCRLSVKSIVDLLVICYSLGS